MITTEKLRVVSARYRFKAYYDLQTGTHHHPAGPAVDWGKGGNEYWVADLRHNLAGAAELIVCQQRKTRKWALQHLLLIKQEVQYFT